jgi:hypothetical protein
VIKYFTRNFFGKLAQSEADPCGSASYAREIFGSLLVGEESFCNSGEILGSVSGFVVSEDLKRDQLSFGLGGDERFDIFCYPFEWAAVVAMYIAAFLERFKS